MTVLYAHTRAETIVNFCLNPSFNLFEDFSRYFDLYWSRKCVHIDQFDETPQLVGHPAGHLTHIAYLGRNDGGAIHQQQAFLLNLWIGNCEWTDEFMIHQMGEQHYWNSTVPNWSTIDIDAPYTHCTFCHPNPTCTCSEDEQSDVLTDNDVNSD